MLSSDQFKTLGNSAFSEGKFEDAIEQFTKGIEIDSKNHVLYSNRSAAYASLRNFEAALSDALKTVELAPKWPKSYSRLALAYHGLDRIDDATEAIKNGLEVDPDNAALLKLREELSGSGKNSDNIFGKVLQDPAIWGKIASNPKISPYLQDSAFRSNLTMAIQNPSLAMSMFSNDPKMISVMLTLMGLDFGSMGDDDKSPGNFETPPSFSPSATAAEEEKRKENNTSTGNANTQAEANKLQEETEESIKAKLVQSIKEEGNAAYRSKDFESALAHYQKAWEQSGEAEPSILSNMAAVYFELGEWTKCIEKCKQAVDLARALHVDFKTVARALTRMGRAYEKNNELESARVAYRQSLAEHRTAETLGLMNAVEKEIAARTRAAYQSPEESNNARERGNALFAAGKYAEAVPEYTEAIKRSEGDVRAFANRSACYFKLGAPAEAQRDAEKAIELDPKYIKGYVRKANVHLLKREFSTAIDVCHLASEKNVAGANATPEEIAMVSKQAAELNGLLRRCHEAVAAQNERLHSANADPKEREEALRNAMRDPEVASILSDPGMKSVLEQMQTDPMAARAHLSDPIIAAKIRKLVSAGIVSTR